MVPVGVRIRRSLGVGVAAVAAVAATCAFGGSGGVTASSGSRELGGHLIVSAASGRCSKAEATAVVKRLGLSDPSVADPVFKVLCGAFTGPGSQTMVVSLFGPGNTGMIDWAVFRRTGGAWQLLMKRHQAAVLTASGSDIRETVPIYRAGDPRCCPSGGTKARTWHWNGSRFTAGAWKQVTPGAVTAPKGAFIYGYFKTPSGNIHCDYGYGKGPAYVRCGIRSGLKPAPPGPSPGCVQRNWLTLRLTGRAQMGPSICPGEDAGDSGPFTGEGVARVLGYGQSWSGGGLRCTSAVTGLTCRNTSGHGFFLSREHWRAF